MMLAWPGDSGAFSRDRFLDASPSNCRIERRAHSASDGRLASAAASKVRADGGASTALPRPRSQGGCHPPITLHTIPSPPHITTNVSMYLLSPSPTSFDSSAPPSPLNDSIPSTYPLHLSIHGLRPSFGFTPHPPRPLSSLEERHASFLIACRSNGWECLPMSSRQASSARQPVF